MVVFILYKTKFKLNQTYNKITSKICIGIIKKSIIYIIKNLTYNYKQMNFYACY